VRVVVARGERWEVTQTAKTGRGPCEECLARERIWEWLTRNGHPAVTVAKLAREVDSESSVRVYSHPKKLVEAYPRAVPEGGITLSFDPSSRPQEFGQWDEKPHRLNLSGEYFGSKQRLAGLRGTMAGLERTGENPRGCNTPEYVITHEFGHCLWYRLDTGKYEAWWRTGEAGRISTNAGDSVSEAFADGFAMVQHLPAAQWPPIVEALHRMLEEDGAL
jgi:hypothetical protein